MNKKSHSAVPKPSTANLSDKPEQVEELSEDMELISPGLMLREARENLSLSQTDIAQKLNFRVSLVEGMENDVFDSALPETFNRGYLASYAKLVSVDVEEVLASYDVLGAASLQRSEMQSFSKQTVKEAEHSRVMWISYIILIVLVGLTTLWWYQDTKQNPSVKDDASTVSVVVNKSTDKATSLVTGEDLIKAPLTEADQLKKVIDQSKAEISGEFSEASNNDISESSNIKSIEENDITQPERSNLIAPTSESTISDVQSNIDNEESKIVISRAVFTFIGDCWVNIYDATGERIAWGIKKSGYVMTIEGQEPLRITLGKPELASIVFNDAPFDMSNFNQGNIAKFTLPLTP